MTRSASPYPTVTKVLRAAQWLADRRGDQFDVVIPTAKARFDLTTSQAETACSLARRFRIIRRAVG